MAFRELWHTPWRQRLRSAHFWYFAASAVFVTVAWVILRKMEHPWEGVTAKRLGREGPLAPSDFGRLYGFWFGLAATVLTGLIALASGWWWRWAHPLVSSGPDGSASPLGRRGWILLAALLAFAAWQRGQHLDRAILRDEQDTLRYHLHGYHQQHPETGAVEFRAMTWPDAAFGNRYGNNPVLMSILSRASLEIWWRGSGAETDRYHPVVIRLPGYLAGIASILVLAWCLAGFAPPRVALLGAALAVIHPLHAEYCIQARGYAYVLLGAPLALGGAIRALDGGQWRHWAALVGGSALMLYAYLGSLFYVTPLVLAVFGILAFRWRSAAPSGHRDLVLRDTVRLLVTGTIGVSLYLTFAMPAVMCFRAAHEEFPGVFPLDFTWWLALWTVFGAGRVFPGLESTETGGLAPLSQIHETVIRPEFFLWIGLLAVIPVALSGLRSLWRLPRREVVILLTACLLSPVCQILTHRWLTHMVLFAYYLIYWLVPLLAIAALGLDRLIGAGQIRLRRPSGKVWTAAAALALLFFAASVGVLGNRELARRSPAPRKPVVHVRSHFHWISYPEGRTLKWSDQLPVPATFPVTPPATPEPPEAR